METSQMSYKDLTSEYSTWEDFNFDITETVYNVFQLPNDGRLLSWSGKLENCDSAAVQLPGFEAVYVKNVGLFDIPLKFQAVKSYLADISQTEDRFCCLDDSCIQVIHKRNEMHFGTLAYSILEEMLNVKFENLDFKIKLRLDKLVICADGYQYSNCFNVEKQPGSFGTLLLQVPIVTDQPSGWLTIQNGVEETRVDFEENQHYFAAAMAGLCVENGYQSYTLHAHSKGIMAVMAYNFIWDDFAAFRRAASPDQLPWLLKKTYAMSKVLASWKLNSHIGFSVLKPATPESEDEAASPPILCIPVYETSFRSDMVRHEIWNFDGHDLLIAKLLSCINFIDVNLAEGKDVAYTRGFFAQTSIKDDIFDQPVNATKIVNEMGDDHVLVIRPRFSIISASALDDVLESIEQRSLSTQTLSMRATSLAEIEELLKFRKGEVACTYCFSFQLLTFSVRFKSIDLGFKVLARLLELEDFPNLSSCRCQREGKNLNAQLVNFICFFSDWEACSQSLMAIIKKHANNKTYHIFCDIGVKLVQRLLKKEAEEIFTAICKCISELPELQRSKGEFWERFLDLAVHLDSRETSQQALSLMKNLSPDNFTNLVKHLGNNSRCYDSEFSLRQLGNFIRETNFRSFKACQFIDIVGVYSKCKLGEFVKSFWDCVCRQCIQLGYLKREKTQEGRDSCLFCQVLNDETRGEKSLDLLNEMACSSLSKEALTCSVDKLRTDETKDQESKKLAHYVRMQEGLQSLDELADDQRFKDLCTFLTQLPTEQLYDVVGITSERHGFIIKGVTGFTKAMEAMLNEITVRDDSQLDDKLVLKVFSTLARFGDTDLMKSFISRGMLHNNHRGLRKFSAFVCSPKKKENAISSSLFNRDMVNMLLEIWITAIANLERTAASESSIDQDFIDCFDAFVKTEQVFIDSASEEVLAAFSKTMQTLGFVEAAKVVLHVFNQQDPDAVSLTKFPSCWKIYSQLCHSLAEKLESKELRSQLSFGEIKELAHSFLWLGEERPLTRLYRNICDIMWHSKPEIEGVERAIISDDKTFTLASKTAFGFMFVIEMMDCVIQRFHRIPFKGADLMSKLIEMEDQRRVTLLALASHSPEGRQEALCGGK